MAVIQDDLEIELHESQTDVPGGQGNFRILMEPAAHDGIEEYAASDTAKELGGILLGRQMEDAGHRYIVVEGYVIAQHTDSRQASLTFTHQSWDQMHAEREQRYPGLKIVGWFHTHPGFGIFLSSYDLFIQKNFFDLPWQVAYVVDPKRKTRGYFRWEGPKIVQSGYRLLQPPEMSTAEKTLPPVDAAPQPVLANPPPGWFPKAALLAAAVLFAAAGATYWQASCLKNEAALLTEKATAAFSLKKAAPAAAVKVPAKKTPATTRSDGRINYIVREGDTLSGICWSLLGDETRINEVAKENKISDPGVIDVDQVITVQVDGRNR